MDLSKQVKGATYLRDLNMIVPGTKNIKYGDLIKSRVATRFGIYNIPTELQWINLENLAREIIQPLFNKYTGLAISSCYRSLELNTHVRGSSTSDHIHGCAVDIVSSEYNLIDIIEWIYKNLKFKKIIAENFPDGWIHISFELGNNDKKLLLKKKSEKNMSNTSLDELKRLYKKPNKPGLVVQQSVVPQFIEEVQPVNLPPLIPQPDVNIHTDTNID